MIFDLDFVQKWDVDLGVIQYYVDYTTIWHRINDIWPCLEISKLESKFIGMDVTGLKTVNRRLIFVYFRRNEIDRRLHAYYPYSYHNIN